MATVFTPSPLSIGDKLQVRLEHEDENEWIDVEVQDFSVQHHPTKCEISLDPYIAVQVDHPKLTSFNYNFYCQRKAVRKL